MNYSKLIVFVFVFILGVTFASENTQSVILRYYFNLETLSFPMYLLMFIPLFIGIVAGSLVGFGARLRLENMIKQLVKSNKALEENLKHSQEAQPPIEQETLAVNQGLTDTE